jgi:hypothetical protein
MRKSILGFAAAVILAMALLQGTSPARADDIPCDNPYGCNAWIGQTSHPDVWSGIKGYIDPDSPTLWSWANAAINWVGITWGLQWLQTGTWVGEGYQEDIWYWDPDPDPENPVQHPTVIYGSPTVFTETVDICSYYHFHTHGSGMGTHEYSVEYSGYHYSNPCGENYVFQAFRDGDWLYITGLGAAALRANANLEVHNPPDSSLTDVGVNYFDGLDLYDGSDWRCLVHRRLQRRSSIYHFWGWWRSSLSVR